MALSSFVYLSNVDNLSDARYAAGMGVDLIGFKLDPKNESSLTLAQFKEISEWISGVKIVGEFGKASPGDITDLMEEFAVDYILISDESQIHDYAMLGLPLILSLNVKDKNNLESTFNYCSGVVEYFLLESLEDGMDALDSEMIKELGNKYPIILGYGVSPANAASVVNELRVQGIALKGSPELRPGYKDFDEMADILEELEVD